MKFDFYTVCFLKKSEVKDLRNLLSNTSAFYTVLPTPLFALDLTVSPLHTVKGTLYPPFGIHSGIIHKIKHPSTTDE